MLLTILGYIGYFLLLFFAITWGIGVRKKYDASNWTIFGALLFLISAIVFPFTNLNLLHSFWIIIIIYLITIIIPYIYSYNIPILKSFITLCASIYANLIRIGIPKAIIKERAGKSTRAFVKEWADKKHGDNIETIMKLWISECISNIDIKKINEPRPLVGICCFFIGSIDNLCQSNNIDDKIFVKYSMDIMMGFNFPSDVLMAILSNYYGENSRVVFATNTMILGGNSFIKWKQSNYSDIKTTKVLASLVDSWYKNPDLTVDELSLFIKKGKH